jgi:hypothetical protein
MTSRRQLFCSIGRASSLNAMTCLGFLFGCIFGCGKVFSNDVVAPEPLVVELKTNSTNKVSGYKSQS